MTENRNQTPNLIYQGTDEYYGRMGYSSAMAIAGGDDPIKPKAQSGGGGSNLGTELSVFDFAAGVYSEYGHNHTTYTATKGIEKNIYKANGQIRSARAAGFARASNLVRGMAIVGSVLSTGYSTYNVVNQYNAGGIQNVKGWDATDAGVGMIGLGATGLAYFGMISNPVGWAIGAGVLIYSGSRLVNDIYNKP
jgi:hypothetical protein